MKEIFDAWRFSTAHVRATEFFIAEGLAGD